MQELNTETFWKNVFLFFFEALQTNILFKESNKFWFIKENNAPTPYQKFLGVWGLFSKSLPQKQTTAPLVNSRAFWKSLPKERCCFDTWQSFKFWFRGKLFKKGFPTTQARQSLSHTTPFKNILTNALFKVNDKFWFSGEIAPLVSSWANKHPCGMFGSRTFKNLQ